eukprot:1155782-Pelagomonas_calceolata.AAC.1
MHLILWKLAGRQPHPSLLQFLRVDELLVDIGDDLTDYEDDVEHNSFNIFRCYAHLFGADAPRMLVQRISNLEQLHAQLLAELPIHLQAHWLARHKEASAEGGSCDGAGSSWEFPSIIYDETAFRRGGAAERIGQGRCTRLCGPGYANCSSQAQTLQTKNWPSINERIPKDCKNKGTRHAFHLGVLLGHTYHIQMYAPAKVMPQFSGCEHVNGNVLRSSACACLHQDGHTCCIQVANGDRKGRAMNRQRKSQP